MKNDKTYYEILEIAETASTMDVKKQYHRLVRKYHPDISHDADTAHEIFIRINEAYKTLRDPVMRKAYDFGLREKRDSGEIREAAPKYQANSYSPPTKNPIEFKKNRDKAFSLFNSGKLNEALSATEAALAADGQSAEVLELKGDICRKNKNYDLAMGAYSKALQIEPDNKLLKEKLMDTVAERNGKAAKDKKGFFGRLFG